MPETTVPTPGKETSEFSLTKLFALVGSVVALLFPLLASLSTALDGLAALFPGAKWIAAMAGMLGSLMAVGLIIMKYIGGRTDVKIAHLEAATAAGQLAAGKVKSDADAAAVLTR